MIALDIFRIHKKSNVVHCVKIIQRLSQLGAKRIASMKEEFSSTNSWSR
jgi:hypothetical protein